jgi:hypothetical protein
MKHDTVLIENLYRDDSDKELNSIRWIGKENAIPYFRGLLLCLPIIDEEKTVYQNWSKHLLLRLCS